MAPSEAVDSSTLGQVCLITSDLFGTDRSKLTADTSLREMGADELDFVELVMELEDHFDVTIPDETAEEVLGTENWLDGMENVTMAKLASLIDYRRQDAHSGNGSPPHSSARKDQPEGSTPLPSDKSEPEQVKVFLNPLVMLLAGAEKKKGQPLTREEVIEIRDSAAFVMMSPD